MYLLGTPEFLTEKVDVISKTAIKAYLIMCREVSWGDTQYEELVLFTTRSDLARELGLTMGEARQVLTELVDAGLIELRGKRWIVMKLDDGKETEN
jgi:CRP-like cAMP-binding protein